MKLEERLIQTAVRHATNGKKPAKTAEPVSAD
jgi:hypothetical protein